MAHMGLQIFNVLEQKVLYWSVQAPGIPSPLAISLENLQGSLVLLQVTNYSQFLTVHVYSF